MTAAQARNTSRNGNSQIRMGTWNLLSIVAALTLLPTAASATSFSCSHARLPTERTICQYSDLGALDERTAGLYLQLHSACSASPQVANDIMQEQQKWLKQRNACGFNAECISITYSNRIKILNDDLNEEPCEGNDDATSANTAAPATTPNAASVNWVGVDPWDPEPFLALRSEPTTQYGGRITKMLNGTRLEVLNRLPSGWWYVRELDGDQLEGWAKAGAGSDGLDRVWIHCCERVSMIDTR